MVGIYSITNIKNNKKYIGSSNDIVRRFKCHKNDLLKNKHHSIKLQRSYNQNNNNFVYDIIEECEEKDLPNREQYWINFYNSYFDGYNCSQVTDRKQADINKIEFFRLYEENKDRIKFQKNYLRKLEFEKYESKEYKLLIDVINFANNNHKDNLCEYEKNRQQYKTLYIYDETGKNIIAYIVNGFNNTTFTIDKYTYSRTFY